MCGNEQTTKLPIYFLDSVATNPDTEFLYRLSDMFVCVISDTTYRVAQNVRSWEAGYHYLGNREYTLFNDPVRVISRIVKVVML